MPRHALIWALALPLVATSVLGGHALAYAVTGAEPGSMHGYLDHAPQVVLVLALVALVAVATEQRLSSRFGALPYLAPAAFAVQEHLERYVHSGQLPMLLADRTFLLGLVLQVPLALVVARLSRRVVCVLAGATSRRTRPRRPWTLPVLWVALECNGGHSSLRGRSQTVRGPPRAD